MKRIIRALRGCFGHPTGPKSSKRREPVVASAAVPDAGEHVVVKPAMQAELLAASHADNSDVQTVDKDQGETRQHDQGSPQRPQRPENHLSTWSPAQVSLDIHYASHPSTCDKKKQERTLRALLDNVNRFTLATGSTSVHLRSTSFNALPTLIIVTPTIIGVGRALKSYDPDVSRTSEQILQCCSVQRPGTEVFDRAAQLLQDLHSWLSASEEEGSALTLLFCAGEALAHAEHMARSAGQVGFWSAPVVRALVALLRVYAAVMERCKGAALPGTDEDSQGSWQKLVVSTLVQVLVRPSLLELLAEVLELVLLNPEFEARSQRHDAIGAAISVLDFMRELVCFAGAQLAVVDEKSLNGCLQVIAHLLSPPRGHLPRVLLQPPTVENMAVQLHTLFLLQQLYDSPPVLDSLLGTRVVNVAAKKAMAPARGPPEDVAAFYIHHHLAEAGRCYDAANGNPSSAFAELCTLHVRLLRSLGRGTALPPLSGLTPRRHVNDLLLSELAAEFDASQAAAAAEPPRDTSPASPMSELSDEDDDVPSAPKPVSTTQAAAKPGVAEADAKKFAFTYDLNEDLERILELEEKLGEVVEVNGFEYDGEGRQLLERNLLMAAEAAAKTEECKSSAPSSRASDGGRPATVPKLSLSSFSRSALSSSRSLAVTGTSRDTPSTSVSTRAQTIPPTFSESSRASPDPTVPPITLPPLPPAGSVQVQQQPGSGLHRHSPSRFSVDARSSSLSATADASNASVRFRNDDGGAAGAPVEAAVAPSPAVASSSPSPSPQRALIPLLDLSALNSSGKSLGNTRRSSAMTTATGRGCGTSGGGASSGGASSGGASSSNAAPRHVPDSANDFCKGLKQKQLAVAADEAVVHAQAMPDLACSVRLSGQHKLGEPGLAPSTAHGPSPRSCGDPTQRLMFRDPKLHMLMLGSALEVSISAAGTLDPLFWQQYPLDNGLRYNLEYLMTWHLNNGAGAGVAGELQRKLELGAGGPSKACAARLRLLRLLCKPLFEESRYSDLKFLARGAFSNVYRAKASGATASAPQQQVIIKSVPLPASCYDRCVLPDVYSEVAIMDQYKGCPGICQLLDYGVTEEAYWLVLKKYRCSLAEWRQRQSLGPGHAAAASLYLSILLQVIAALKLLARKSIVHFDLKCQNVLIDPREGAKDAEIWNPLGPAASAANLTPSTPSASEPGAAVGRLPLPVAPFQAVLADFGEARSYRSAEEAFTVRTRGTEVYKSPEMLLLNQRMAEQQQLRPASPAAAAGTAAAKAALQGAGLASDVWSLGCLAFELLSGKVLFGGDYASVTHRVAFGGRGNLVLTAAERGALGDRPALIALIEWVLARDPAKRPSLDEIESRVRGVQEEIWTSGVQLVTGSVN